MRHAAVLLLLAACTPVTAPPPPQSPPRPPASTPATAPAAADASVPAPAAKISGDLLLAFSVPAWDARLLPGQVVVIDEDLTTVSSFDTATGARRWRTTVAAEARGRRSLSVDGGLVQVWAGERLHLLDPADGRLVSSESFGDRADCTFLDFEGTCALACSCSLQVVDCRSGAAIGPRFAKTRSEEPGRDGGAPTTSCRGEETGLVTAGDGVVVVSVEDASRAPLDGGGRPPVVIGLERTTGKERWRSAALAERLGLGDVSADGKTCWTSTFEGELFVFACGTGKVLWKAKGEPELAVPRLLFGWQADPPGLYRQVEGEATLHEAATGRPRWRVAVPDGHVAAPVGFRLGFYEFVAAEDLTLLLLDPASGATRARIPAPAASSPVEDPGGGFWINGRTSLAGYEPDGRLRARLELTERSTLFAGPDYAVLRARERLIVLDRSLNQVGEIAGDLVVHDGSSLSDGLLLYRSVDHGERLGEALLVRRR